MTRRKHQAGILLLAIAGLGALVGLLSVLSMGSRTATIDVDFKLIEFEKPDHPLAGVPIRLVLGKVRNWQSPSAGHSFVTDEQGAAHFSVEGIVDRVWTMVPYAMTGLSIPQRADHIFIAAELEQVIPTVAGEYRHFQWLHTMEIHRYSSDLCGTSGISDVYTRDARGWFTVRAKRASTPWGPGGLQLPELNGMELGAPSYKTTGLFLSPEGPGRWKVPVTLERHPPPTIR